MCSYRYCPTQSESQTHFKLFLESCLARCLQLISVTIGTRLQVRDAGPISRGGHYDSTTDAAFCVRVVGAVILAKAPRVSAEVAELKAGSWSGGAALGFLSNPPDKGFDFALKGHADYFVSDFFSLGPVAQYAGAGSDFLFGLTLQPNIGGTFQDTRTGQGL